MCRRGMLFRESMSIDIQDRRKERWKRLTNEERQNGSVQETNKEESSLSMPGACRHQAFGRLMIYRQLVPKAQLLIPFRMPEGGCAIRP